MFSCPCREQTEICVRIPHAAVASHLARCAMTALGSQDHESKYGPTRTHCHCCSTAVGHGWGAFQLFSWLSTVVVSGCIALPVYSRVAAPCYASPETPRCLVMTTSRPRRGTLVSRDAAWSSCISLPVACEPNAATRSNNSHDLIWDTSILAVSPGRVCARRLGSRSSWFARA